MSDDQSISGFSRSRRRVLKTGLSVGVVSLAGCSDPGDGDDDQPGDGDQESDLTYSGAVLDVRDEGVADATVAAMATIDVDGVYSNRVIASGETDANGQFEIPVDTFDSDEETLVRHTSSIDVVLLAQWQPDDESFVEVTTTGTWFGQRLISGSNVSGTDAPPVPGTETEHTIRMNRQTLFNGWGSSLNDTDATIWRTVSVDDPTRQSISTEVRGEPSTVPGLGGAHVPLSDGELALQLPDDQFSDIRVEYPSDQQFRPRWAKPSQETNEEAKWFNVRDEGAGLNWGTYSLARAYESAVDQPFTPPLYAFFDGRSFSPLTDTQREAFEPQPPGQFEQVDEDIAKLFVSLAGEKLGDIGTALSAVDLADDIVSYPYETFDLPRDEEDPQFLGNASGPEMDGNVHDSVTVSWPAAEPGQRPPAVVQQTPLRVSTETESNLHPLVVRGLWRTEEGGNPDARVEHGMVVDFATVTPATPASGEDGSDESEDGEEMDGDEEAAPIAGRWPQRLSTPQNTGYSATSVGSGTLEEHWSFDAADEYDGFFGEHYSPATDGELLYVCTGYGPLVAVRPDGSPAWQFTEPRGPNGVEPTGLAVDDERVYMTMDETTTPSVDDRPAIYAVSKDDGEPDWRYRFPDLEFSDRHSAVSQPTLANGLLYVFGYNPRAFEDAVSPLIAIDVDRREVEWRQQVTGVGRLSYNNFAPAVANGAVFVKTRDKMHAYDAMTGEPLWESDVTAGASRVVVTGDMALVLGSPPEAEESGLLGYDISNVSSEVVSHEWTTLTDPDIDPGKVSAAPDRGVAYVTDPDSLDPDRLHVVNTATGETLDAYTHESVGAGGDGVVYPAVTEDIVYFGDPYGTIVGIDRGTGEPQFQLEHGGVSTYPLAVGDQLYTTGEELRAWRPPNAGRR